jgi:hypothetical protein
MPECQQKVSPASAFLPVVSCLSPASAFRHQCSIRYRWSRISPGLPNYSKLTTLVHASTQSVVYPDPFVSGSGLIYPDPDLTLLTRKSV